MLGQYDIILRINDITNEGKQGATSKHVSPV